MAFITKEWKDRLTEFAGRRRLTNVATGEETVVEVARAEGMVSQPGDAFSAANMNDLEQRVKDGFDEVCQHFSATEWQYVAIKGGNKGEGNVYYRKVGTDVELRTNGWGYVGFTIEGWSNMTICTLPEGFRPKTAIQFAVGSQYNISGYLNPNGELGFTNVGSGSRVTSMYAHAFVRYSVL